MNKKEVNEIRLNLKKESGFMTIGKIASVYVNGINSDSIERNISYMDIRHYNIMESELSELIVEKFCKNLTGKMGKSILEFSLNEPNDNIFMETLQSAFNDDEVIKKYIDHIIDNVDIVSPYTIFTAYCTYSVINKDGEGYKYNPETDDSSTNSYNYNFIITCICPVETQFNGIICTTEPKIEKEKEFIRVEEQPLHGWIYPAFNDRMPDTNNILYSSKNVKSVSRSIVENVLGCEFFRNANEQKDAFVAILTNSLGNLLDYDAVEQLNDTFCKMSELNAHETEPVTVDKECVVEMLDAIGYDDIHKEHFKKVWDSTLDDNSELNIEALINSKSTLTTGSFKITYNNGDSERVKINKNDSGKKVITIEIDDNVEINGIPINS